ncbi:MAG: UDP-N-acetylmuramoyl-tripeptide--D-alanyl-D-alanine ligase, partial [Eubacteriales bacterium]|nr:UDP-N-acetylmuramoyl-tripeptide--D-alanyl-D-alanine ligase [Eubacteriales bacterium]
VDPDSVFISNVCTDSRKIKDGDLFIALVGERFDGNQYAADTMKNGAAGCIVSSEPEEIPEGRFAILTEDTGKAMGALAAWYLSTLPVKVIAVTGSVGKTTTKDMIASVLSAKFRTHKTQGNLNNHLGLPMTIFGLDRSHEMAVLEMGMNHPGEIDYLTRIAGPDVVTITNVGDAHIGILGSRENIMRAKCEIFHGLKEGGLAVLNGDDALLKTIRRSAGVSAAGPDSAAANVTDGGAVNKPDGGPAAAPESLRDLYEEIRRVRFACHWVGESEDCDYRAEQIDDTLPDRVLLQAVTPKSTFALQIPSPGRHMIYAAMTAAAIGQYFGMRDEEIAAGVAQFTATRLRMETLQVGERITLYNDTYNANPQSMMAALRILANAQAARKVAVLGDMLELEPYAEKLHREVGVFAAELPIDTLLTVGPRAAYIAEAALELGMEDVRPCADKEEAKQQLALVTKPDTAILFKASRGMALEELCAYSREIAG